MGNGLDSGPDRRFVITMLKDAIRRIDPSRGVTIMDIVKYARNKGYYDNDIAQLKKNTIAAIKLALDAGKIIKTDKYRYGLKPSYDGIVRLCGICGGRLKKKSRSQCKEKMTRRRRRSKPMCCPEKKRRRRRKSPCKRKRRSCTRRRPRAKCPKKRRRRRSKCKEGNEEGVIVPGLDKKTCTATLVRRRNYLITPSCPSNQEHNLTNFTNTTV